MDLDDDITDLLLIHGAQRKTKSRAPTRIALDPDSPAMGLDNRPRNRQANAHPLTFRRNERLKQLGRDFGGYSRAGIRDGHRDQSILCGRRYDQLALVRDLHGFDCVPDQVQQHLLDLDLVCEHQVHCRIELEPDPDPMVLGPHERQRARLLDELPDAFHAPLALATGDKVAQAPDDLACPLRLLRRLVHCVAQNGRAIVRAVPEQTPRTLHIIGDGRQRLVELVGQRRCHLAHGRQSRYVHELRLQLLQPRLGLLPLGQVANKPGEEAPVAAAHLANGKLHRKGGAILALTDDDAADADDPPLSGAEIPFEIAIVVLAIWRRHYHLDVLAHDLAGRIAEQSFGRGAEGLHHPAFVDDDHRVGHRGENGFQVGFAASGIEAYRPQTLAEPRDARAESREGQRPRHLGDEQGRSRIDEIGELAGAVEMQPDAQRRGKQARPPPAEHSGDQDGWHEKEIEGLAAESGRRQCAQSEGRGHQQQ